MKMFSLLPLLALTILCSSCERPEPPQLEVSLVDQQVYQVKGVLQMTKGDLVAIIDHEEIPGFMAAMVMPFKVKDAAELEGLKPGAVLEFDYVVSDLSSWMENVKDTGETAALKIGQPQDALPRSE